MSYLGKVKVVRIRLTLTQWVDGGTQVDVNFGSRPSGTGSGVNHIYFDLRPENHSKALK